MKYLVTVGGREYSVEVDGEHVSVDGAAIEAAVEAVPGTAEIRLVSDGVATVLGVDPGREETWRLVHDGAVHEVTAIDERTHQIRQLAGSPRGVDGHAVLRAPMPGLVLRVLVARGDMVAAGDSLIALEAMKMENDLKAAGPGRVEAVLVAAGQAVEKGACLLELGPVELPQDIGPE